MPGTNKIAYLYGSNTIIDEKEKSFLTLTPGYRDEQISQLFHVSEFVPQS
jgi:hypothetical protein